MPGSLKTNVVNTLTNMLFSFGRGALLAGLPTVLALLSLSAAAQTPARSAFEILEVGRWSNPPKKVGLLPNEWVDF